LDENEWSRFQKKLMGNFQKLLGIPVLHSLPHYLSLANEFLNNVNVVVLRTSLAVVIILADNAQRTPQYNNSKENELL
jgi:hypothetical protein